MKFTGPSQPMQCEHVTIPGELTIDSFDGQQCTVTNPRHLGECPECGKTICLAVHWGIHYHRFHWDSHPLV